MTPPRRNLWRAACAAALLAGAGVPAKCAAEADWPGWRGPQGNNHADPPPPAARTGEAAIAWRASTPGRGHSSPCVAGDHVYLTAATTEPPAQFLLAYDRRTGALAWRRELHAAPLPVINDKNSHASATPACDGRRVYAVFAAGDALWASAVGVDGTLLWQRDLGAYRHANGLGASPALYGELLLVCSDNQASAAFTAVRTDDGSVAWRTPRPVSDNSATPIVAHVAGRDQAVINGAQLAAAYDPQTGRELWRVRHQTEVAACTAAWDEQHVFVCGKVPVAARMCLRADGSGDVTATHVVWTSPQAIHYVPSPLVVGDHLFTVTDDGVAYWRDAATDRTVWKKRLGDSFSASPLLVGDRIYALSEAGRLHVLVAGDRYESVAVHEFDAECLATPAICGGVIYLRTADELIAIGAAPSGDAAASPR